MQELEFLEPDLGGSELEVEEKVVVAEVKKKKVKKSIFEDADISNLTGKELSDLLAKHTKKAFPSLSDLELDGLRLLQDAFGPGSKNNASLPVLEKYLTEIVFPDWKDHLDCQKPVLLILSSSAIRCVELLKMIPKIRSKCTIAKLFAKHFKLADQLAFLASHKSPIAIGTPARILRLGQEASKPIDFDLVAHVLIDTARDGKDRTVFDVPEVRKELIGLLVKSDLARRLNSSSAKIYFF